MICVVLAGGACWVALGEGDRVLAAGQAGGQTRISVHDRAGLLAAINSAHGGETIVLAPGVYADLAFKAGLTFTKPVTITSADRLKRAVVRDFTLNKVHGVRFTYLELAALDRDVVADGSYWGFKVLRSKDIHFDNVSIHGSLDGDPSNDVSGLQFRWSSNVSVTNSEFQQLERGLLVSQVNDAMVYGNTVHDMRSDGLDFVEVGNVKITGNTIGNFRPAPGDHPDGIQFWTRKSKSASHDVLIADNVILRSEGEHIQGIFMRDEELVLHYERMVITNNLVVGTGYHGISIGGAKGLTITNNTLITYDGEKKTWLKVTGSDDVTIIGNSATVFDITETTNIVQKGNTVSKAVKDRGVAAMRDWTKSDPSRSDRLRIFLPQ